MCAFENEGDNQILFENCTIGCALYPISIMIILVHALEKLDRTSSKLKF